MNRAVFLDRDGVLNPNVFNPATGAWESPHRPEDFRLFPWVPECIRRLRDHFLLFLVSNQPSYAKGKTSLENIREIQNRLKSDLEEQGLGLADYFYCHHHPEGIVPEFSGPCECRKPSPYFLLRAKNSHHLDMEASWMVGDRKTDIQCGKAAGVRTLFILGDAGSDRIDNPNADFSAKSLEDAVNIILNSKGSLERKKP